MFTINVSGIEWYHMPFVTMLKILANEVNTWEADSARSCMSSPNCFVTPSFLDIKWYSYTKSALNGHLAQHTIAPLFHKCTVPSLKWLIPDGALNTFYRFQQCTNLITEDFQSINQSNFYSANIPDEARPSGATAESVQQQNRGNSSPK